jgi:hypothetical protein
MPRFRNKTRMIPTATTLPDDVHEHLAMMASDHGVSVAALLRWGAMLVIRECNEAASLPPTVARLRRVAYGGQIPRYANEVQPEVVRVDFNDDELLALKARAGGRSPARFLRDLADRELRADVRAWLN